MLESDGCVQGNRKWFIFIIIATGTFMALLSASSINVALPMIEREFNTSLSGVQWVVTAYLLVISSVLPIFGWAGDMTQRKYIIAAGFAVFGIGGLFCSLATSLPQLIVARIIQGIGASMNMANSYAALTSTFPANQRGRVLGMNGSIVALGSISGPAVGGMLLDLFGWHSIFYITIPFALIGFIMALICIPKMPSVEKRTKFDAVGAILIILAISSLIISLSQWGRIGWSNTQIIALAIAGFIFAIALYFWERKRENPLIDLDMFRNKVFLFGNLAGLCAFLALNSNNMLMPFYLHRILDATPKLMGMVLMVFPIMVIITAPISGFLSDRYGAPRFAITGMGLMTLAMIALSVTAKLQLLWTIIIALIFFGMGNGMFQSPNNSTTLSVIPVEKHGMAGSIVALMRNLGAVIGTAIAVRVCDMVAENYMLGKVITPELEKSAFIEGYQTALLVGATFAFCGFLCSLNKRKNLIDNNTEKKNVG